jgi:hypothetical protein
MEALLDHVRSQLRAVFAGRSVILAGGVAASAVQPVDRLRGLGAERFLVASSGAGTGGRPDGTDVELIDLLEWETPGRDDVIASFREEERAIAAPSDALLDAVRRFDPRGDAIVLVPPFIDVRRLGDRPVFGARRSEWVALEDKTIADELFDATGVPRPASAVVPADASAIASAAAALDRGEGTVWSADAREGFNGGGAYVRWVRGEADRRDALDRLLPKCDRVRVAAFVDGVPCSIHGFVVDDGVAVFRPVELVTLRAPSPPRLRYCGCATFFDPPAVHVATMRAAVSRIGDHLREHVGYRGAFTLDGIASPDGWVATECNPRFGAGLGYANVALPELCLMLLHYAVVEGVADVPSAALENAVVEAGARTRWGGAWTPVTRRVDETSKISLVGGVDGFRHAIDGEPTDAVMELGPGRTGGFVRLEFDTVRTPRGPSIAPLAVAGFAFADRELDLGLGPLTPARPAG